MMTVTIGNRRLNMSNMFYSKTTHNNILSTMKLVSFFLYCVKKIVSLIKNSLC